MNIVIYPSDQEKVIQQVHNHEWYVTYNQYYLDLHMMNQTIHLIDSNHLNNRYKGIDTNDILKLYQLVEILVLEARKEKEIIDLDHIMQEVFEISITKWMEERKLDLVAYLNYKTK